MARDQETIECPVGVWTQLTNDDVTAITFQVISGACYIRYTTDETPPGGSVGMLYGTNQGEQNANLSDLVNLSGAARVWARGAGVSAQLLVDHA